MILPYLFIPADAVSRPYVWATLHGAERREWEMMLVDSGADISLMPARLARKIGIGLGNGIPDEFEVADGSMAKAIVIEVDVEVCGIRFPLPVAFLESDSISPLLGQRGFLDRFEIRFRRYLEEFKLTPA